MSKRTARKNIGNGMKSNNKPYLFNNDEKWTLQSFKQLISDDPDPKMGRVGTSAGL